jgi:hypothetical protein
MSKQLDSFLLNIHISFDYITDDCFNKMKLASKKYEGKKLNDYIYHTFQGVKNEIYLINYATKKIKNLNFDFLNDITFLGFNLNIFQKENAKTKQVIVKYIFNMFNPIYITIHGEEITPIVTKPENKPKRELELVTTGNPLENLLNNKQIMDLAGEISRDISQSNIDPMSMISGLLSGNGGGQEFQDFMEKITSKIDNKMNNGELDKTKLEQESESIIKSLGIDTTREVNMSTITDLLTKFQT